MLKHLFVTTAAAICWLASAPAGLAATTTPNPLGLSDVVYSTSLSVLTMLFVIALLLESAFSTIFNWRVFLTYFSTRGVKTIIMIVISFIVVYVFNFDAIASLIAAFKLPEQLPAGVTKDAALAKLVAEETGAVSKFITSLILAGGSAGIYNLMVALGFRSQRAEVDPKPPVGQAWVAVRVKRVNAVGPVNVMVAEQAQIPAGGLADCRVDPIHPSVAHGVVVAQRRQVSAERRIRSCAQQGLHHQDRGSRRARIGDFGARGHLCFRGTGHRRLRSRAVTECLNEDRQL